MSEEVGIIAFAFGQQGEKERPVAGPANEKITDIAWGIYATERLDGNHPLLAVQWETSISLPATYIGLRTSQFGSKTHYVSTQYVLNESIAFFREHGVKRVILVGHPLHLFFINLLVKNSVWKAGDMKIDHQDDKRMKAIPYDRSDGNVQPWTRGPTQFMAYMVKAFLTGKHGS